jgi:hypothetical protein
MTPNAENADGDSHLRCQSCLRGSRLFGAQQAVNNVVHLFANCNSSLNMAIQIAFADALNGRRTSFFTAGLFPIRNRDSQEM